MRSDKAIRVVIADEHPVCRRGLVVTLRDELDMDVVAEAVDAEHALDVVETVAPDVVLLDIGMHDGSGKALVRELRERLPDVRILILTFHIVPDCVLEAARAGAHGFILKTADPHHFIEGIRAVHGGQTYFGVEAARVIVDAFVREASVEEMAVEEAEALRERDSARLDTLTARERQVLSLVAKGFTSREIADQLRISTRTVEAHRARVADKLRIRSVAELTRYAVEQGLA